MVAHVRGVSVHNAAHFYNGPGELDLFTKGFRAIGRRKNGSANVQAYLAPVDVKGGHDLNVARAVAADLPVHQSHASAVGR